MQNVVYAAILEASGGIPPYTWSIASGLPPGLTLNSSTGAITGTTATVGTYSFTAQVTDSSNPAQNTAKALSIAIMAPDTTPPTAPVNLTAVASGPTQINLNWTASTDNVGVTGYQVVRNGSQIATSSITSYADTTVAAGTTYSYIVRAYDAAGNVSPDSNTAAVTTPTVSSAPVLDKTVTTRQASGSSSRSARQV